MNYKIAFWVLCFVLDIFAMLVELQVGRVNLAMADTACAIMAALFLGFALNDATHKE